MNQDDNQMQESNNETCVKNPQELLLMGLFDRINRPKGCQEDGLPKGRPFNRRRRTREGPELACVQTTFFPGVAQGGEEGRINVLPWYRPVGVDDSPHLS